MAKESILIANDEQFKFVDESTEIGYNYEAFAVNKLLKKPIIKSHYSYLEK